MESTICGGIRFLCTKGKIERVKCDMKKWNMESFGKLDDKIEQVVNETKLIDDKGGSGTLVEGDILKRKALLETFWKLSRMQESFLYQRSRLKWLQDGDSNTSFFHACVNKRLRENSRHGIRISSSRVEEPERVKEGIFTHFETSFKQNCWMRTTLDGILIRRISEVESKSLTAEFTLVEIKNAVWGCEGNKSPGPDGYNFNILKKFWNVVSLDFCRMVSEFHSSEKIVRGCNASFLVLIPKKENPVGLNDYRPISLVGCIYKVLAKMLAERLGKVMHSIISNSQTTFLKGRIILDGVVVLNEVLDYAKKSGKLCMIFKVDFKKAYDSVSWEFLDYMFFRIGFNNKWRSWIRSCLHSASVSVLVNGSPTRQFITSKGICQGDPMALFLLLVVAEGLNGLIRSVVDRNVFKEFILLGRDQQLGISHIQYTDDMILVDEMTIQNARV